MNRDHESDVTALFPDREIPRLRQRILAWYGNVRRPLPWRRNSDAYRVWVAEVMLQQTTVKSVLPYYEGFLAAFPGLTELAKAPLDAVLALWSGLGYYSRARNLQAAALRIVRQHGGRFPRGLEEARSLPGVGPYTAAAVLSIAYGLPHAVLDGNVARVLARFCGVRGSIRSTETRKTLQAAAARLLDPAAPGDFNQAMMEIGAVVCTPRTPRCPECPLAGRCEALRRNLVTELPESAPASPTRREALAVVLVERRGRILLQKRPEGPGLMPGLWELPTFPVKDPGRGAAADLAPDIQGRLRQLLHPGVHVTGYAGETRHAIMNRRIRLLVFLARCERGGRSAGRRWVSAAATRRFGTSSIVRKSLALAGYGIE